MRHALWVASESLKAPLRIEAYDMNLDSAVGVTQASLYNPPNPRNRGSTASSYSWKLATPSIGTRAIRTKVGRCAVLRPIDSGSYLLFPSHLTIERLVISIMAAPGHSLLKCYVRAESALP